MFFNQTVRVLCSHFINTSTIRFDLCKNDNVRMNYVLLIDGILRKYERFVVSDGMIAESANIIANIDSNSCTAECSALQLEIIHSFLMDSFLDWRP